MIKIVIMIIIITINMYNDNTVLGVVAALDWSL